MKPAMRLVCTPPSMFGFGAVLMIAAGSAAGSYTGDANRPPGRGNSSEGITVADSVTADEVCAYNPGTHNIRIRIAKIALRLHMNRSPDFSVHLPCLRGGM